MLTDAQYRFLETSRVGHLATADAKGVPHLVPVCYAVDGTSAYITVDEKPKRTDIPLKRLRNIGENPAVALTVDRWDEDWSRLAWVMLRGRAVILDAGQEHDHAQHLLRDRYQPYRSMDLGGLPVIAIRISRVMAWGDLTEVHFDRMGQAPPDDHSRKVERRADIGHDTVGDTEDSKSR